MFFRFANQLVMKFKETKPGLNFFFHSKIIDATITEGSIYQYITFIYFETTYFTTDEIPRVHSQLNGLLGPGRAYLRL
jgi:hypothetical protein